MPRIVRSAILPPLPHGPSAKGHTDSGVKPLRSKGNHRESKSTIRAFSVNFRASNSTITLMFKEQVGVPSEKLSAQQAATLKKKNCNVFVLYNNGKAILQHGTMAGGWFFDERHGLDWLQNLMQTEVFNLLYTSNTKIPQTEQGMGYIETTLAKCCGAALTNGLIAPGVWNSDPIGDELDRGAALSTGFYIYHQPIADQFQSDREQRTT